jgi:hypothetical protein
MSTTWVSILALGRPEYALAAREAVRSTLAHTPFSVSLAHDGTLPPGLEEGPRLRPFRLDAARPAPAFRFLAKLDAAAACLREHDPARLVLLDADAVFVSRVEAADVDRALGSCGLGMVEQERTLSTGHDRAFFLAHYAAVSLAWVAPELAQPPLASFRYHNSGVVLGRASAWREFLSWAAPIVARTGGAHAVDGHMVADQDYLQVFTNSARPGTCATLGWEWNHSPLWHEPFPRPGARVVHLSNFCAGPDAQTLSRLRAFRRFGSDAPLLRLVARWIA